MAIIKCSNGHYYDSDKYPQCPHCGNFSLDEDDRTMSARDLPTFDPADDDKTVSLVQGMAGVASVVPNYGNSSLPVNGSAFAGRDDGEKTIGIYEAEKGAKYIVGWLVCISGPVRGRDYRLYPGFNRIGRDYGLNVAVMEDQGMSREAACSVVYDERGNKFYAVQQQAATAYLNGTLLAGAVELSSGDVIKAGTSEFEFVAFCREGRVW